VATLAVFNPLFRGRVTTLIKTCRSERKAEDNQQVVTNADQLLAPSLSTLSSCFATICHNYDYVFMTAARRRGNGMLPALQKLAFKEQMTLLERQ